MRRSDNKVLQVRYGLREVRNRVGNNDVNIYPFFDMYSIS